MQIKRFYSSPDRPVKEQVEWQCADARITDARTGAVIFEQCEVTAPAQWSQTAINILAQKYFRKAGVPHSTAPLMQVQHIDRAPKVEGSRLPDWLSPRVATRNTEFGGEQSAHQVFHRMAGCWTYWGWRSGLFRTDKEQARIFYDEIYVMLALQVAAPNSPQWFNTGLWWAYGIEGGDSGQWICDDGEPTRIRNSYERPQPHACFLTSISDDLVNDGGIMDAWVREARIFKHGSGSGTNLSKIRAAGEPLSGGGVASGVMSWLRIADRAAGAIASGGTTRRAATMRILDDDHPEIEAFVNWKAREEAKAAAMYLGSAIHRRAWETDHWGAERELVPSQMIERTDAGFDPEVFGIGWEGEAIETVSGQNSNNSIRVTDEFMRRVNDDGEWDLIARTGGSVMRTVRAHDLWFQACRAAWACADPGVVFADNVNAWNTCAADGEINTTNPCSEFWHLCGTEYGSSACNLASLRLTAFLEPGGNRLDLDRFEHAAALWTMVLDISVTMASFPAREFALGAYNYRTLGLGYADLGGLLSRLDIRYDSDEGRSLAAGLTALMTGVSYQTSAQMAQVLGSYPRYEANAEAHTAVIEKHWDAFTDLCSQMVVSEDIMERAEEYWRWSNLSRQDFRNAQVTLLAPTGTISLVMDCATTGIEPHYSTRSVKNLAGGGTMTFTSEVREEDTAMALEPMAHIRMMAAVQPFLSGGISKTVNMPRGSTVEDVDRIYRAGHEMGLKAVAIYRDGSKLSQPLSSSSSTLLPTEEKIIGALHSDDKIKTGQADFQKWAEEQTCKPQSVVVSTEMERGDHEFLPWRRERGYTQKAKIDGTSLFWRVSEYPDGRPGEIFIELAHEGTTLRATANCVAIAISVALQYGVPLDAIVDKYIRTKFEPAGLVEGHARIRFASSFADLIARDLAITYLGRDDLASTSAAPARVDKIASGVVTLSEGGKRVEKMQEFDIKKYDIPMLTGETCRACGGLLLQTGTCRTCSNCDWNEGCG